MIVARGLGRDVDVNSSLVAFGLGSYSVVIVDQPSVADTMMDPFLSLVIEVQKRAVVMEVWE